MTDADRTITLYELRGAQPGPTRAFSTFDEALEHLGGRTGAFVLRAWPSARECLALAELCTRVDGLDVGLLPSHRDVAQVLEPRPATGVGQIIFDGLRCGFEPASTRVVRADRPTDFEAALAAPADVAYFIGHSNGLHADGAGLVITRCHVVEPSEVDRGSACSTGDRCFFDGMRFDPARLGARRVVGLTCWGMRFNDLYDDQLKVGGVLFEQPHVECYLASVRVLHVSGVELGAFFFLLNSGLTSAEVVRRVNRARIADGYEAEYLCFGSPISRQPCTVTEAPAQSLDDGRFRLEVPPDYRGHLRFRLPGVPEHQGGRVLVIEGRPPSTAIVQGHDVFISLHEPVPAPLVARLETVEALVEQDGLTGALLHDLAATDAFFSRAPGLGPEERAHIASVELETRRYLSSWPFISVLPGSSLGSSMLEAHDVHVEARLASYAEAVHIGYSCLALNGGPGGAVSSGGVWMHLATARERWSWPCAYCPGTVAATRYRGIGGQLERVTAYCDRCGLVLDGDGKTARVLAGPEEGVLGSTARFSIDVHNPYPRALVAHVAGYVQAPRPSESTESEVVHVPVPAHGHARIELDMPLTLPYRGVYAVVACVVIGTRFDLLRSHIRLVTDPAAGSP
jgi:hypothetical protein